MAPLLPVLLAIGCASVQPREDFDRAGELVRQRVPATQVYHPQLSAEPVPDLANDLTLEEALQLALLGNRQIQAAFDQVGIARADLVQSQLLSNPMLGLRARFPEGGGRSNLMVDFGQEIADFWQIPIRRKVARAELDQAVFTLVRQAVEVAAAVKVNYHRLQYLQLAEQIVRENVEIARQSSELTRARLSAGQVGKIDADLARTAVLQAELALIDIRREVRSARYNLALAMGLARWPAGEVALDPVATEASPPVDPDQAVAVALANRADLLAAARQIDAAAASIRLQNARVFPSVVAGMEFERMEARAAAAGEPMPVEPNGSTLSTLSQLGIQPRAARMEESMIDAMAGPTLSFPLPIFDQNQAQIARAAWQYRLAVRNHEQLALEISRDVQVAASDYLAAAETVRFYEQQLMPQLRESLETATAAYRAGSATVFAVLDAQRSLVETNLQLNQARLQRAIAQDELERALGGPLLRAQLPAATQPAASRPS